MTRGGSIKGCCLNCDSCDSGISLIGGLRWGRGGRGTDYFQILWSYGAIACTLAQSDADCGDRQRNFDQCDASRSG